MKRRSFLAMGGATGVAVAMSQIPDARAAVAAVAHPAAAVADPAAGSANATLRGLAARVGLRVGTAVIPQDLNTPAWNAILAEQFSVVTPGNAMKWGPVEPQPGVFDWSDADTLVSFAEPHGQLIRGHTLLWHNQFPTGSPPASRTARSAVAAHVATRTAHFHRGGPVPGPDLAVGRRQRVLPRRQPRPASTRTTSGSPISARASSRRRSSGRTRRTRMRCSSTTTTTSPARTARTPRATRSTRGCGRCWTRACPSTASATRGTSTPSSASLGRK